MGTVSDKHALALRLGHENDSPHDAAAVELLIAEGWHMRPDFIDRCTSEFTDDDGYRVRRVRWDQAQEFLDSGPLGNATQIRILTLALAIADNQFGLTSMGRAHAAMILRAVASAMNVPDLVRP